MPFATARAVDPRARATEEEAEAEEEAWEDQQLQLALAASLDRGGSNDGQAGAGNPAAESAPVLQAAASDSVRLREELATLGSNAALFADCLGSIGAEANPGDDDLLSELLVSSRASVMDRVGWGEAG